MGRSSYCIGPFSYYSDIYFINWQAFRSNPLSETLNCYRHINLWCICYPYCGSNNKVKRDSIVVAISSITVFGTILSAFISFDT